VKLGPLLAQSGIAVPDGAAAIDVRSLVYDSRRATPGALFVAIPGFHRDGASFAADAVARGAVAVVAEQPVAAGVPSSTVHDARAALADLAAEYFDHPTERLRLLGGARTEGRRPSWLTGLQRR